MMVDTEVSGNEYLALSLKEYGVTHVFMVPTFAVPALAHMDALGITGVTAHGEKAAVYMADGYARARGAPGVCTAQSIGASNLAAGLRDPYMAGSPVLAITGGNHPRSRHRHVYQEVEDFSQFDSVTKANFHVDDVRRLPDLLRQAFRECTSGAPGPVHLQVQGFAGQLLSKAIRLEAAPPVSEPTFASCPALRSVPGRESLLQAATLLLEAKKPVLVVGGGALWSSAQLEVSELATRLGIPVATSLGAKGMVEELGERALGVVGSYSRASANRAVAEADLVFFVGSHTGSQVTDNWRLPSVGTPVMQLDIDPSELGRNYPNEVSLFGDAKASLRALLDIVPVGQHSNQTWLDTVAGYVREWRDSVHTRLTSPATPIRPERLCRELNRVLPDDAILVCDTGHAGIWMGSLMDLHPGQRFLRCAGSLGWALPATLGARCGAPNRPVVGFTGDGGLYYHLAELETAARHNLDMVIVVNDNASLNQDMDIFRAAWHGEMNDAANRMWQFKDVDLASVARRLGCSAIRVEDPEGIADGIERALNTGGPVVVDVVTDQSVVPDPPFGGAAFYRNS